jgi:hypothetical protein
MDKKEVTTEQFNSFLELFKSKHPEIDMQLPSSRSLINGSIFCNQPAKMPDEMYDIYFRFLRRWYMDNGFIPIEQDLVYVSVDDGKVMAIDTDLITSINRVSMELTNVSIKEKESDIIKTITIKEDADYFKNRVYIF